MDVASEKMMPSSGLNSWKIKLPFLRSKTQNNSGMEDYISVRALLNLKCTQMQDGSSNESLVRRYKFVGYICLDSI